MIRMLIHSCRIKLAVSKEKQSVTINTKGKLYCCKLDETEEDIISSMHTVEAKK
ncbi:MAG: hypothetical protein IJH37_07145 [Clostridia bacterium]|nr:hypothetical protein [Clostridia bacterium]